MKNPRDSSDKGFRSIVEARLTRSPLGGNKITSYGIMRNRKKSPIQREAGRGEVIPLSENKPSFT
jgi:hypothetical protein